MTSMPSMSMDVSVTASTTKFRFCPTYNSTLSNTNPRGCLICIHDQAVLTNTVPPICGIFFSIEPSMVESRSLASCCVSIPQHRDYSEEPFANIEDEIKVEDIEIGISVSLMFPAAQGLVQSQGRQAIISLSQLGNWSPTRLQVTCDERRTTARR